MKTPHIRSSSGPHRIADRDKEPAVGSKDKLTEEELTEAMINWCLPQRTMQIRPGLKILRR